MSYAQRNDLAMDETGHIYSVTDAKARKEFDSKVVHVHPLSEPSQKKTEPVLKPIRYGVTVTEATAALQVALIGRVTPELNARMKAEKELMDFLGHPGKPISDVDL